MSTLLTKIKSAAFISCLAPFSFSKQTEIEFVFLSIFRQTSSASCKNDNARINYPLNNRPCGQGEAETIQAATPPIVGPKAAGQVFQFLRKNALAASLAPIAIAGSIHPVLVSISRRIQPRGANDLLDLARANHGPGAVGANSFQSNGVSRLSASLALKNLENTSVPSSIFSDSTKNILSIL